jgi:hypothetical protein
MMAWLLFVEPGTVPSATPCSWAWAPASLTKFCHKKLRMKTTAIELNPQVVAACRGWFKLPADNARCGGAGRRRRGNRRPRNWRARWMRCRWTCTTTRPPRRCWTAPSSMPTAAPADRRRLHDRQPVWPLVQLRAQPREAWPRPLARRRALGLQAHARGQHRGAGAAHAPPAQARRAGLQRAETIQRAGACPPPSGCGCSNPGG